MVCEAFGQLIIQSVVLLRLKTLIQVGCGSRNVTCIGYWFDRIPGWIVNLKKNMYVHLAFKKIFIHLKCASFVQQFFVLFGRISGYPVSEISGKWNRISGRIPDIKMAGYSASQISGKTHDVTEQNTSLHFQTSVVAVIIKPWWLKLFKSLNQTKCK